MTAAISAEQRKYFSTSGWIIGLLCLLAFGMVMPVGNAISINANPQGTVSIVAGLGGVADFGLMVLMVIAATSVTQEYRFGTANASFLGLPGRVHWLAAKATLMAVIAALSATVLAVLGVVAVSLIAAPNKQDGVSLVAALPQIGMAALTSAVMAVLAVGVGALVRSTAFAVALIVLWPTVVELLLAKLPGLSEHTPKFLLWANAGYAMTGRDMGTEFLWGPGGAVAYLAVIAAVVFVAGAVVTKSVTPSD